MPCRVLVCSYHIIKGCICLIVSCNFSKPDCRTPGKYSHAVTTRCCFIVTSQNFVHSAWWLLITWSGAALSGRTTALCTNEKSKGSESCPVSARLTCKICSGHLEVLVMEVQGKNTAVSQCWNDCWHIFHSCLIRYY